MRDKVPGSNFGMRAAQCSGRCHSFALGATSRHSFLGATNALAIDHVTVRPNSMSKPTAMRGFYQSRFRRVAAAQLWYSGRRSHTLLLEDRTMPKFVTIGYGDREGYDRTPEHLRARAHAHDESLKRRGAVMGIAGSPVQVRNAEASGIETEAGPFMSSQLPIAGFAIIEADDIDSAVRLVAESPCAVAYGVVEVWPLVESGSAA